MVACQGAGRGLDAAVFVALAAGVDGGPPGTSGLLSVRIGVRVSTGLGLDLPADGGAGPAVRAAVRGRDAGVVAAPGVVPVEVRRGGRVDLARVRYRTIPPY